MAVVIVNCNNSFIGIVKNALGVSLARFNSIFEVRVFFVVIRLSNSSKSMCDVVKCVKWFLCLTVQKSIVLCEKA